MALALALADHAARALCAELSMAEMQDICVSAWLVALSRVSLKQTQRTWVCLCKINTFVESKKTKVEKEYGYQQNNNLLGKHQGKRRII